MARIEFKWTEPKLNLYDGFKTDDILTSLPGEYRQADQPLLIFVTSSQEGDLQTMANIESSVLKDEKVSIGATLFRQVKFDGQKIKESHPYWKTLGGKALPRMIVVDTSGQKVGAVEGQDISASKVFGLIKQAAARTYKTDIEAVVKETKAVLTEIDQIEAKRTALKTKIAASTAARTNEWAKEEKALDLAMQAIEAREASLKKKWTDERKVAKA